MGYTFSFTIRTRGRDARDYTGDFNRAYPTVEEASLAATKVIAAAVANMPHHLEITLVDVEYREAR